MKKNIVLFGVILILLLSGVSSFALELQEGNILVDDQDEKVEPGKLEKVVSLSPAITEMIYMIGQFDKLIGVATSERSANWPEEVDNLTNVGSIRNVNIEEIVNIDPDLVLGSAMSQSGLDQSKELGYKTAYVSPNSIEEIFDNMLILGELMGGKERAQTKVNELKKILEEAEENIDVNNPKSVVMLYNTNPLMAFGRGSLSGEVLEKAGLENILDIEDSKTISLEYLLEKDPDYIFLAMRAKSAVEEMKDNPVWQELKAVQNENIMVPATEFILRQTPRLVYGVQKINQIAYGINK